MVQLQTIVFKDDTKLLQDTNTILHRLPSDKIYTDFVMNLTKELSKAGKDYVLHALIADIKNGKRLLHYEGVLNLYQQDLSGKAPDLTITTYIGKKENNNSKTTVLKTAELNSKFTLLVFYKSGCGPCEDTMQGLKENYQDLLQKDVKIISIAGDTDLETFNTTATQFPWSEKHCDVNGVNGVNFKKYAVIGTPTMYILDKKGAILSKMATITEVLEFINKK